MYSIDSIPVNEAIMNDYYDIGVHNRNMDKLDANAVKSSGVSEIRMLSQDTYDSITPEDSVLYLTDKGTMYLGSTQMKSGGGASASTAALSARTIIGTAVNAEYQEVSD